jgi:hypothetical protein
MRNLLFVQIPYALGQVWRGLSPWLERQTQARRARREGFGQPPSTSDGVTPAWDKAWVLVVIGIILIVAIGGWATR